MIKDRDIVVISVQPWYFNIGSFVKNVATEFAKNNRVLYVNRPLDRITVIRRKHDPDFQKHIEVMKSGKTKIELIKPNMWNLYTPSVMESVNKIPSTRIFSLFNRMNNKRYAREIQMGIDEMGFKDYILFNDKDIYRGFYLNEYLDPDVYVYCDRDYIIGTPYWKRHGTKLEPKLIAKADVAVGNSYHFVKRLKKYNPNAHYVGSGCNLELYDGSKTYEEPEDMKDIPRPVVGYTGSMVDFRLDIEILRNLSKERPDYSIVLVGPEDEAFQKSDLHDMKNVYFLGHKKVEELPGYINAFDVAINPQIVNDITYGNYPLKIDEYLAIGKPVLATRTDAMGIFEEHSYLADHVQEWPELIDRALREDSKSKRVERIAFAHTHSWSNTVGLIYDAIEHTLALREKQVSDS